MATQLDFKKISTDVKNWLGGASKVVWTVGVRAFWVVLFFIMLDVLLGAFLFYKYIYAVQAEKPAIDVSLFKFDETAYKSVLSQWQARQENMEEFSKNTYPNPF